MTDFTDEIFTVTPMHPENPITLHQLSVDATVTFSLDGVMVAIPIPDDPHGRVVIYRMDRHSDTPWTVTHNAPAPEKIRIYSWGDDIQ